MVTRAMTICFAEPNDSWDIDDRCQILLIRVNDEKERELHPGEVIRLSGKTLRILHIHTSSLPGDILYDGDSIEGSFLIYMSRGKLVLDRPRKTFEKTLLLITEGESVWYPYERQHPKPSNEDLSDISDLSDSEEESYTMSVRSMQG